MMGWLLDDPPLDGPDLVNLAASTAGATIKVSSEYFSGHHLIDRTANYWMSNGASAQDATIRLPGDDPPHLHLVAINPYNEQGTPRWAKDVEVSTSLTSPYKGFESRGRLELSPIGDFQVLRFPEPVPARYLRIRFLNNHGDKAHIAAGEVVALGER